MTREEAINYLQPIADSASLPRYAEALEMAIAALREQPRWISVTERLPTRADANHNESVLAIAKDDGFARA